MKHLAPLALLSFLPLATFGACTEETAEASEDACSSHADCSGKTPFCDEDQTCAAPPAGSELGWGEGAELTVVLEDPSLKSPTDLAFNPSQPNQLWVINSADDSVVIITEPGKKSMTFERRRDPAASHFMDNPPALAMGAVSEEWGQTFGICGDSDNGGDDFMGPALFSARLDVFATATPTGLGSHLDMLHSTPYCRGIEHIEGNAYFVFNSVRGSLDRYDFAHDHGPGNDDHSDGEILRYVDGALTGVEGIPSHLAYDAESKLLYVADTGTGRVLALDTTSGSLAQGFGGLEPVEVRNHMRDAVLTEFVPAGTLTSPSGVEFSGGVIFVSDTATSTFYAFSAKGKLLNEFATGLPPGSLAGFEISPGGKVHFVDMLAGRVMRIDPIKD